MGEAENRLKKLCLDALTYLGHDCWNTNQGMIQGKYKIGRNHLPDIQGYHCHTGVAIYIETKIRPRKMTPGQRKFLEQAAAAGCIALEVTCIADLTGERRLFK